MNNHESDPQDSRTLDKEISLLEVLRERPNVGQRDMAEAVGLSLGMTNLLLRELSAKGWMLMRKLNARKVQYVLTPEGLKELTRRSYRFLKKTIRHVADVREQLTAVVHDARASGLAGLCLVGASDLDFVLEGLCRQQDLPFRSEPQALEGWFVVHGENEPQATPNVLEYMEAGLPEGPDSAQRRAHEAQSRSDRLRSDQL